MFNKNLTSQYKDRILKAFPTALSADVKEVLEVLPLNDHKVKLSDGQIHHTDNLIHSSELHLTLEQEKLIIPYRLYFNEPDSESEKTLTDKQKAILSCIFLRHHNGFLREQRLKQLTETKEYWVIPFMIQLLGEYVYEILKILNQHINDQNIGLYVKFIQENPKYWQQTEGRMISYWNEYYRSKFPDLKKYVGLEIVKRIKKRKPNTV